MASSPQRQPAEAENRWACRPAGTVARRKVRGWRHYRDRGGLGAGQV